MDASVSASRPSHSDGTCDRSDQETGRLFATSRVEGQRETVAPGAATESLMMPLEGGGMVRFTAVHGRVEMQIRVGKQRTWLTTPISVERAYDHSQRLVSIARAAAIQRQNKGA